MTACWAKRLLLVTVLDACVVLSKIPFTKTGPCLLSTSFLAGAAPEISERGGQDFWQLYRYYLCAFSQKLNLPMLNCCVVTLI